MKRNLLIMAMAPAALFAAFNQKTAWDVQQGGSDLNGGGFDTSKAAPAVDRSQSTSPYITFDGTTCAASGTSATPTVLTIAGCTPGASTADTGNVVHITGGSHFVAGWYQITASTSSTWTLDRNATDGSAASGMAGRMGGCFATPGAAFALFPSSNGGVGDMAIFVKYSATPYAMSTGVSTTSFPGGNRYNRLVGYYAAHEDAPTGANRPTIQAAAAITLFTQNVYSGWVWENLILDGAGVGITAFTASLDYNRIYNCKFTGWTGPVVKSTQATGGWFSVLGSEFTANSGSNPVLDSATFGVVADNWFHDNTIANSGVILVAGVSVLRNVISNNMGSNVDAIVCSYRCAIIGNTIYRVTNDAIKNAMVYISEVFNNVIACAGRYGINFDSDHAGAALPWPGALYAGTHHNAFWSNGSANKSPAAMVTTADVALSGSGCAGNGPFTAPAASGAGDWSLNASVGASVRSAGVPGAFPGMTARGYLDMGALQHADPTGSSQTAHPFLQ